MVDHCSQVETVEYHTASELSQRAPLLLVVERREEGRGQRRLYNLRPFSGNSRRSSFPTPPRRARHPDAHSQSAVRDQRGSRRTLTRLGGAHSHLRIVGNQTPVKSQCDLLAVPPVCSRAAVPALSGLANNSPARLWTSPIPTVA
ncbi:uncharacterized protein LOC144006415 isoform X4 [Festucalex cinctus]